MTAEQWRRLEDLFIAAQELPREEQAAFIARETGGDMELNRELAGMLAHATTGRGRIERAIEGVASGLGTASDAVGTHVGPYRISREIGRGGMGVVFEAVRDDDEYRKTVALKVAPWSRNVPMLRERFKLERQILAELEHPNIARFLDGGTVDGTPYFVMELVQGLPITEHCRRANIDLRGRLALFQQVCAAVDFAHQSLVVHRDLKPANVLVDETGAPKLLDFGVAKLLDPLLDSTATLAAATAATGGAMWTPDYTSPEQVRGRNVTVRTDVYSLGLILYELLSGVRAQKGDLSSPVALEHSICVAEAPRPSEAALRGGDASLARRLRGDLDTIVMTAIRKEPERRYASVAALSEDIGRYLDGRPIEARPSTFSYRASRLLMRHRAAAVASTLIALSVVGGGAAAVYEARRAERRFQDVRSLANAFVFDVHDRIATLPGSTEARKAIVSTALTYLERLRDETGSDEELALELAGAYERVGTVQGHPLSANLGDTSGALESYARAEALAKPLADRGNAEASKRLVSVWQNAAVVLRAKGDAKAALSRFEAARDTGERAIGAAPNDAGVLSVVGEVYANLSRHSFEMLNFQLAEQSARRAIEIAERLVALHPENRDYQLGLSTALNTLGTTDIGAGNLESAVEAFRKSAAIRERIVAQEPNNLEFRRNLMVSYGNLGDILGYRVGENIGDTAGAGAAFAKTVEIAEWARKLDPSDRRAQFDVVNARLRLGALLVDADPPRSEEALLQLTEARGVNLSLLKADPGNHRYGYVQLVIDRWMGQASYDLSRLADARRSFEAVHNGAPAILKGPNGPAARSQAVQADVRLADIYARTGDARAAAFASSVHDELGKSIVGNSIIDANVHGDLGGVYLSLAGQGAAGRVDRLRLAVEHLEKSAAKWRAVKVSPALEARRQKRIASIEADLSKAKKL